MTAPLGIALALRLVSPAAELDPPDPAPPARFCDLAVRAELVEFAELEAAVELRLPAIRVRNADGSTDPACAGQLHGYVSVRMLDEGRWELGLVAADGRAWFRTVEAERELAARSLASALANLVAAIEESNAEPDAVGVAVPAELDDPAAPALDPAPEPGPAPAPEPGPAPAPAHDSGAGEAGRLRLELGPHLLGGVLVGLTPSPGVRAAGGGVGFDLRLPAGPTVAVAIRTSTAAAGELRLIRTRVAVGAGWIVRVGVFELPVILAASVEPWSLRVAGQVEPLDQPPLLGGGLRLAPGLRWAAGPVDLRLGLALGLELAVEAAPGGRIAAISRAPAEAPVLRAGGLELAAGVELGVWIPVRR